MTSFEQREFKIPETLITWMEKNINSHEYGRCIVEFVIHLGKIKIKRTFEETIVDIETFESQKTQ